MQSSNAKKLKLNFRKNFRRSNQDRLIRVSLNEVPYPILIEDFPGLEQRLAKIELNRYPTEEDVKKVERLLATDLNVPTTKVCLGNGLDDILFRLMLIFRDRTLGIVEPGFPCYELYANRAGMKIVKAPLSENFCLNDSTLNRFISTRPDLIVLAYPNNPTGNCFDRTKIEYLLKKLPGTIFIIDEAYYDFSKQSFIDLINKYETRLACTRTLSKGKGLAGVRSGFLVGPLELVKKLKEYELPFHFNHFMLLITEEALNFSNYELVEEIIEQREKIYHNLKNHPFLKIYPSQANFFWCKEQGPKGWMKERFARSGICVKTYSNWPDYYRFSIGTPEENELLLEALKGIKGI